MTEPCKEVKTDPHKLDGTLKRRRKLRQALQLLLLLGRSKSVSGFIYANVERRRRIEKDENGRVRCGAVAHCTYVRTDFEYEKWMGGRDQQGEVRIYTLRTSVIAMSIHQSKIFAVLQSYSSRLSVVLLSYDTRSTLIRQDS